MIAVLSFPRSDSVGLVENYGGLCCKFLTSREPSAREEGWVRQSTTEGERCVPVDLGLFSCVPFCAISLAGSGTIPVNKKISLV